MAKRTTSQNRWVKRHTRALQMNPQRRKLLTLLAKGLSISEAGRLAGYSSAETASKARRKMSVYMPQVLAKLGMPVEKWAAALLAKTRARETKFFDRQGVVIETREVAAHDVQLRALIEVGKLHNAYPKNHAGEDGDSGGPARPTFNLVIADARVAEAILERLSRSGRNRGRAVLDAGVDEDEGRARPA